MTSPSTSEHAAKARLHQRIAAAALFVFAFAYFGILAPYGLELADEGHLLHQIYRTYLGQLPYVDFHTGYSPGVYYFNAWLLRALGLNLVTLRLALALVNTLCVVSTWWLAKHVGASPLASFLAGLAFVALIPFFDGQFAPFNIPYPAWYVTLFWLLAVICVVRWWERGNARWWFVSAALAALVFSFKQNSGMFALATCAFCVVMLQRPEATPGRGRAAAFLRGLEQLARWAVPLILLVGLFRLFGGFTPGSAAVLLVAPLAVLTFGCLLSTSVSPARPVAAGVITRDLVLVAAGFAAVTLPWMLYFGAHLGAMPMLRAIFHLGSGYEQYYLIPYPSFGPRGWMFAAVAVVVAALPRLVRGIGLTARAALVLGGLGLVAGVSLFLLRPPLMVEGFESSVTMAMRDVSFPLLVVVLWCAVAAYFSRARRAHSSPVKGVHLILVASAILMHMQIYPRSDFMHLVYAAPCALVLAAWLLDRWALELLGALGVPRRRRFLVRALFESPAFLVALVFLASAVARVEYLTRAWWRGDESALVRLASPYAPLVIEPSGGRMFQSLSQTIGFIDAHTRPGEFIFTFPCLDTLTFLADRQDTARHGYYYPGSPGHGVEAEVIDALEAAPPRYVITLHDHALFFLGAPVYYFNLRDYVTAEFGVERRFGMIDILAPKGDGVATGAGENGGKRQANDDVAGTVALWRAELRHDWGGTARVLAATLENAKPNSVADLAAVIAAAPAPQQRLLANLVQKSRSASGAAALAMVGAEPQLPEREFQLFMRIVGAVGDLQSVPALEQAVDQVPAERRPWIAGDLFYIGSKAWIEKYFYAPDTSPALDRDGHVIIDSGRLINWMQNPWENPAIRSFALRMAGRSQDTAVVPFLVRTAGDGNESPQLRLDAAHSLVDLGYGAHALAVLGNLLRGDDLAAGALIAAAYHQAPEPALELILANMQDPDDDVRRRAYWIAGAVRDPRLSPLLVAGLDDPLPEVRTASVWVLGQLGRKEDKPALERAASDPDEDVRQFAKRALRRLNGGAAGG